MAASEPLIQQSLVKSSNPDIPLIDLSKPESQHHIVKACQDFGFFKVVNHGVPTNFINKLESEAVKFFSSPAPVKEKFGPPNPFGYGNKNIGRNGDVGWVEYLLLNAKPESIHPENFKDVVNDYVTSVKTMTCGILELLADEMKLQPRNVFSKLLKDKQSDAFFRINHNPPCQELQLNETNGEKLVGFGEHTDPQIVSVLRSNNIPGLEISLRDGSWVSVPPDSKSFFFIVGDCLQVMTNGRFKSVKHRVMTNGKKSRVSMIYFGGPPVSEKIAPIPSLMQGEEGSLYKEFTWFEYKKSAFNSRLSVDRLALFEKK